MARREDGCLHRQENRGTSKRVPPESHVGGISSLTELGEPYGDLTGKLRLDHLSLTALESRIRRLKRNGTEGLNSL